MTAADTVTVRYRTEKLEDTATRQKVLAQLVTESGDVLWHSTAIAQRRGPLRWDYSKLYKQRRDADAFLRSRPDLSLAEEGI